MDLFKLLGTIAIDSAGAKKELDELSKKGEKTESKLSKAFSSIGKGATAVGKAVGAGMVAAGSAMGALTVKALNLSGELEQNMGGSEQVFKDYAGKMQETAKQAFSNMGLSTSDFLATANKMGALFQGAGFSIEESSELSASAMQRAADVASIMGVDTSAAMEAIAGAAKGNFTMMDNLGVAMNDTTLQAYALSKGIDKATKDMTNQEKISLAMEMFMEKTAYAAGNYARENETLAGSLGTAKAALTNFLDGSGDVDQLVTSFSNLTNVVVKNIKEIAPRLVSGITDIVNQVIPMLPPLIQELLPVIIEGATKLLEGLVRIAPNLISSILDFLPSIIEGLTQLFVAIVDSLPVFLDRIIEGLMLALPSIIEGIVALTVAICNELPNIVEVLVTYMPTIMELLTSALIENLPILIAGLISMAASICAYLPTILSSLWTTITTVFNSVKSAMTEPVEKAKEKIKEVVDAIKGFFSGLKLKLPDIKLPHFKIDGELSISPPSVPKLSIDWYQKAMNNPMIMNEPTIFGYNPATGSFMGGGEAGSEVVSGTNTLLGMIQSAVSGEMGAMTYYLQRLVEMLADYFPQVLQLQAAGHVIDIDGKRAAKILSKPMNEELGTLTKNKDRGR